MSDIIFVDRWDEDTQTWCYYRAERRISGIYVITDETDQHGVILPTSSLETKETS